MGAKSSESCLIEIQSVGEVSDFDFKVKAPAFRFPTLKLKVRTFKIMI